MENNGLKEVIDSNRKLFSLVISTPFYQVKGFSPYIVSLANSIRVLQEMGIPWDYYEISGDSYVDRAKNSLVKKFLESEYSHLFMVDSDMGWTAEGFARLVKAALAGAEMVGALYPCKNNWDFFGGVPYFDSETKMPKGIEWEDLRLLNMFCVPGGSIIYSRRAFERTMSNVNEYTDEINQISYYEFFKCNVEVEGLRRKTPEELEKMKKAELMALILDLQKPRKGSRIGEDVYFQQRYKEMGGIVWCEPNINIRHVGIRSWEGNYQEQLLNGRGATETNPMPGTVSVCEPTLSMPE